MGIALYRKYRSRTLDEIVGQEHVTNLLANALKQDRIGHAYLFTGPRGVGKTSIARIIAHEINKLPYDGETNHLDIIEIDAASNNGVDDIRDLREKARIAPTSAPKKVYIIDEVHMLSKPAFNALLKTLEEPPAHVVFIMATTDADKIPDTILSRSQRYSFHRATKRHLVENLRRISQQENIKITDEALDLLADHSDGSYRDSVSLLDQMASLKDGSIREQDIEEVLGLVPSARIDELADAALNGNFADAIAILQGFDSAGIQPRVVADQLLRQLQVRASQAPEALRLIDGLFSIARASVPYAKLLSVIGLFAAEQSASSASVVADAKPEKKPTPKPPTASQSEERAQPKQASTPKPASAAKKSSTPKPSKSPDFDWKAFCTGLQSNVGIASILTKASGQLDGSTLMIYAGKKFWKDKLDTAKCKQAMSAQLANMGYEHVEIEIVPSAAPHADSQIASITAMMGGGEEVDYNDA